MEILRENKRNIYIAAGIVVVVVGAALAYTFVKQEAGEPKGVTTIAENPKTDTENDVPRGSANTSGQTGNLTAAEKNTTSNPPINTTPPERPIGEISATQTDVHDGLSFQQAMDLYRSGYRYQFINCSGKPGSMVIKQATRFMLDNRDPLLHLISLASQNWNIPGYDFVIAKSSDIGTHMITCDGGGSAEITVVP